MLFFLFFYFFFFVFFFFFNDTATTEIYTLSLHDALPISVASDLLLPPAVGIIRFELPELEPIRLGLRRPTHTLPGACQAPVTSPSSSYAVKQIASGCWFKSGARSSSSHTFHVSG